MRSQNLFLRSVRVSIPIRIILLKELHAEGGKMLLFVETLFWLM